METVNCQFKILDINNKPLIQWTADDSQENIDVAREVWRNYVQNTGHQAYLTWGKKIISMKLLAE